MLIRRQRRWESGARQATPEGIFFDRRQVLAGFGFGAGALLTGGLGAARAATPIDDLFPARKNEGYGIGKRMLTPEDVNAKYNNFYEYTDYKDVYKTSDQLKPFPWQVKVDGLCEAPKTFDATDLIRRFGLEERLYRHRCVEAWSMTVPWTGFPLKALVDLARPLSSAKYLLFETFLDPAMAPGQRQPFYPWPYVEGLTMAEATNDLAFMVVGAYGKPLRNQFGAPLRLAVPWKYGFKSIKSIVRVSFVEKQPVNFWQTLQSREYGFWANVNPAVPHPRWSQASERDLGSGELIPTEIYNGYGEEVAGLYSALQGEVLFR